MEADAIRRELNEARKHVADLEAAVVRGNADLAALRRRLTRLQRGGHFDEADNVSRQIGETEKNLAAIVDRLSASRTRASDFFGRFVATEDPADLLGRLETGQAIALLPVRLETRFRVTAERTDLLVRIYPDDIHVETHEPELTEEEVELGEAFWKATRAADDGPEENRDSARLAAWAGLAGRLGPERAAWVARALVPEDDGASGDDVDGGDTEGPSFPEPPLHAEPWTRAPKATTLPDRFLVLGYRNGEHAFAVWGQPVPDPLPVGPQPDADVPEPADGEPAIDPALKWMYDFDEAERVGMGVRVPVGEGPVARIDLVVAVGVKASADTRESTDRLARLLDGHHYTGGLGFVRQGSPSNNTGEARSAFDRPDETFERSFAIERGDPLVTPGDGSNGQVTAAALGLDPALFAHVADAGLTEQAEAADMHAALWHATWGYYLEQIMAPTFGRAQVDAFRRHFIDNVRGRGPLPALRVGNQPYGLLPVTTLDGLVLEPGEAAETPGQSAALDLLRKLRDLFWKPGTARVPNVEAGGDPDRTLLEILGMDASSLEIAGRPVFGGHYFRNWWSWQGLTGFGDYTVARDAIVRSALQRLGLPWSPRALNLFFMRHAYELTAPRVQAGPLSETDTLAPNYIEWLRTSSPAQVRDEEFQGSVPKALLYLLLRHTALTAYGTTAFRLIARFEEAAVAVRAEPELIDFEAASPTLTASNVLDRRVPALTGTATLAEFLDERRQLEEPDTEDYGEFWAALERLEPLSTAALDRLLGETLDVCSHRLDAWITSFAGRALRRLRTEDRSPGVHLGAFGWVENLEPSPARASDGFVHAPSLQHATTAAILRSGYLSHRGTDGASALAIDLSSARVRLAIELLDAVRQGQPLGAVLGYRFERGLHEDHPGNELDRFILPFRELAPLVAKKLENTDEPVESIAAHNVVDGLALSRRFEADDIPWGQGGLPALGSADEREITIELRKLGDVVDALSDAVTAESVYQAVRGNPTRAGAVLDAIARGEAPPPELESVRTTRSGIALTHRVLLAFADDGPPAGWPADPRRVRARAEPRLDAWLGTLLGSPDRVRCNVEYLDAGGAVVRTEELHLGQLGLSPLDVLPIAGPEETEGSELVRRIVFRALNPVPAGVPGDASVRVVFDRDPAWGPEIVDFPAFGEVVRTVRELVGRARALSPADVATPGEDPGDAFDTVELEARGDDVLIRAGGVLTDLEALSASPGTADTDALREALVRAAYLGLPGAFPASARGTDDDARGSLSSQAAAAVSELAGRVARATALETAFDRGAASPVDVRDHDVERIGNLLGKGFVVLPRFSAGDPGELAQAIAASDAVQDGDPGEAVRWLRRMTRVRPRAALFGDAFLYADALGGTDPLELSVAQLPFQAGDRWIGLPIDEDQPPEANRVSLVASLPAGFDASSPVAGLLVDEWVETLPAPSETTGLAFHFDQPDARAPNAVLIAVPPDGRRPWDLATLEKILLETFELAKIRAVDTEALAGLGQFLPALFFTFNTDGRTVSTDFTRVAVLEQAEVG
jgi:hypothetical protein